MKPRSSAVVLLLPLLLSAACAPRPAVTVDPDSDPREARRLLASAAAEGPVPVTVRGEAPLDRAALLAAVERGVRGLDFATTLADEGERRFVLDYSGGTAPLCDDAAEVGDALQGVFVRAAFCDGERAVARAGADPVGDPERLVWRLMGRLVPDDYPETYGFGVFGNRITFGFGAAFGF